MSLNIAFGQDIIDTRDLVEYVEAHNEAARDENGEPRSIDGSDDGYEPGDWDHRLLLLAEQAEDYCVDYHHGETLIHEDYFVEYAKELANDIGAVNADAGWPARHIDWEAAADSLKEDYEEFTVEGTTYYGR